MSRTDGTPEVFGDGDVTLVIGSGGVALYVGQVRVGKVRSVKAEVVDGRVSVDMSFLRSSDSAEAREIEENARTVKTIPWIRVTR